MDTNLSDDMLDDRGLAVRKTCSIDNRLRLKRTNIKSANSQCSVSEEPTERNVKHSLNENDAKQQLENANMSCDNSFENENDSMVDFKSPESTKLVQTKLARFTRATTMKQKKAAPAKFKALINDRKKDKSKQCAKNRRNSSESPHLSHSSIESSFFKPRTESINQECTTNVKTAFVCPLCFKPCKDSDSQALHMKICAAKNKVSTKKLLDAIELQKRQEDERKSLGLLGAPMVQDRKKPVPCKMNLYEESDLQLALALSKSLQEAETLHEIHKVQPSEKVSSSFLSGTIVSAYKDQLEKFGFANSKDVTAVKKKRKKHEITVLQTRSHEERNRILTERIAEILMGNEPITQKFQEEVQCEQTMKKAVALKNRFLQKFHCTEDKLWDKTRLTTNQKGFYVLGLSEHIMPQEKEMEEKQQDVIEFADIHGVNGTQFDQGEKEMHTTQKQFYIDTHMQCLNSLPNQNKDTENENLFDSLVTNWGNALNDSSMSDVIIFVNNDKYIWTHKLVFFVRCSNILLDIMPNDNAILASIKEKVSWHGVSYNVALAFLEFIYCGIIKKYRNVFEDATSFTDLRNLARKYKVKELFGFLRQEESITKRSKEQLWNKKQDSNDMPMVIVGDIDNVESSRGNNNGLRHSDSEQDPVLLEIEKQVNKPSVTSVANTSISPESELEITFPNVVSSMRSPRTITSCSQTVTSYTPTEQSLQNKNDFMSIRNSTQCNIMSPDMFDDMVDTGTNDTENYDSQTTNVKELRYSRNVCTSDGSNKEVGTNIRSEKVDLKAVYPGRASEIVKSTCCDSKEHIDEKSKSVEQALIKTVQSPAKFEGIKSIINTPRRRKSNQEQVICSNIKKQKSNLSLFIEQVQRENARSDFDTDSDDSVPPVCLRKNRNPFNINENDDTDRHYLSPDFLVRKNSKIKGLGVFDRSNISFRTNQRTFHETIQNTETPDNYLHPKLFTNLTQSIDYGGERFIGNSPTNFINEPTATREESLEDAATIAFPLWTTLIDKNIDSIEENLEDADTVIALHTPPPPINDTTISDVDADEDEISMYTKYTRKHRNNSIATYREMLRKYLLNHSVDNGNLQNNEHANQRNTDNEDIVVLSDIGTDFSNCSTNLVEDDSKGLVTNFEEFKQKSQVVATDNADLHQDEYANKYDTHTLHTTALVHRPGSCDTEILINDEDERHTSADIISCRNSPQNNFSLLDQCSTSKLMRSKSDSNIKLKGMEEYSCTTTVKRKIDQNDKSQSPVWVSSSPESRKGDAVNTMFTKKKMNINITDTEECDNNIDRIFEEDVYLANVYIGDRFDCKTSSPNIHKSNQEEGNSINGTHDILINKDCTKNTTNNEENCTLVNNMNTKHIKRKEGGTSVKDSIRKLKKKSASERSFGISARNITSNISRFNSVSNQSQCKCNCENSLKKTSSPVVIRDNVSPPPDYDGMKTPELHMELKKYGLKLQKRSRAVKLLTYIYDELHPVVPVAQKRVSEVAALSSEDEELPLKKMNREKSNSENEQNMDDYKCDLPLSQCSNAEAQSPINIIAEEMQFDKQKITSAVDNTLDLKERFLKLIKVNKELYNKILTYDPLCIESLHSMLKSEGFKCKINTLMDFLDGQCITFYCQDNSVRSRTKKT